MRGQGKVSPLFDRKDHRPAGLGLGHYSHPLFGRHHQVARLANRLGKVLHDRQGCRLQPSRGLMAIAEYE
jgi:hypothetical protein